MVVVTSESLNHPTSRGELTEWEANNQAIQERYDHDDEQHQKGGEGRYGFNEPNRSPEGVIKQKMPKDVKINNSGKQ